MNNYIKRFKTFSFAGLLLCLAAVTLTQSISGLTDALWEVEECVLSSYLISAKTPENGDVDRFEDEFADGMQDHWDQFPKKGQIVDMIKKWDHETYNFGGFFQLSSGERIRFERLADHESASMQTLIELWKKSDTDKGGISRPVIYQPYHIKSAAFSERKHKLLFADGAVRYGNFDYYTKESWGLVLPGGDLILDLNTLNSKAVRLAEPWIGAGATPEGAYFALRTALSQHTTRVPLIGWEVSSRLASMAIAFIALYVVVILTHSTYGIRDQRQDLEEPWLAIPSFTGFNPFEIFIAKLLSVFGIITLIISVLLPFATITVLSGVLGYALFLPIAGCILFFTVVSLITLARMIFDGTIKEIKPNKTN